LIIGKQAITPDGEVPNVGRVNDGLRVVVFLNEPRQTFDQIGVLDWER